MTAVGASLLSGGYLILIGGTLLAVAVVVVMLAGNALVTERRRVARRLELSRTDQGQEGAPSHQIAIEDDILQQISRFVTPNSEEEVQQSRQRLIQAGYRRLSAVRVFHLARAASGLGFALIVAIISPFLLGSFPLLIAFALIVVSFFLGFVAPSLWLDHEVSRRKKTAEEGFPDALDLLLVCIEAGQGFDQAARRIARELKGHNKVLAEEFTIMNEELFAGKERLAAFRDFAQRLAVSDIIAFVAILRQADEFGVSIAEAIRVYAEDMRHKRVMRAEEKANVIPVKLALASMAFTVPPTMLIMVGPSLLMLLRSFSQSGGG